MKADNRINKGSHKKAQTEMGLSFVLLVPFRG
jgi:hypothetical protein